MLNASEAPAQMAVIDYPDPVVAKAMASGVMNTGEDILLANIASSIRRGHPQMKTHPIRPERICLVGSGPSLNDSLDELKTVTKRAPTKRVAKGARRVR